MASRAANKHRNTRKWVTSPSYEAAIKKIVSARKEAGMSQATLAKEVGKHPPWVAKVEQRERRLDIIEFIAVARALGMKEADLLRSISADLPKKPEI